MKDAVNRILNGKFDYEKGALDISSPRIELSLCPGELYTGSFFVSGAGKRVTEGHIYSNDVRIQILNDSFLGGQEIGYTFSAAGLEEGDVVQGEIYIISSQGEYYIPYTVTIQNKAVNSSLGSIKNLFHFTNLAKANWDEAVKLFYSDSFDSVFTGSDRQYLRAYLGLSRYYGNEQNVEEFLLTINKKHPVEFIPAKESITVRDPEGVVEEYVNITRNGWGYSHLYVSTDADFIILSKNEITDIDFLGNYLNYSFQVDPKLVGAGISYATIFFRNSFCSFEVKVVVNCDSANRQTFTKHLELWHLRVDLMTYFEAFRNRKVTMDKWIAQSNQIVDRMLFIDEKMMLPRLYKAQLLLTEERYNEAKWILDQVESEFIAKNQYNSTSWAYYLYLTTLYNREESYVNDITTEVENIYAKDPSADMVAWLLLYLSEEYVVSPSRKWLFIEKQVNELNSSSPLLYIEALNVLNANPSMLNKLNRFEIVIMRYAARNELLNQELVRQFVYLALKHKEYSDAVYEILKACYEIWPSGETLTAICELLIRGNKTGEEYYPWYLKAIEQELRITMLYEYCVNSMNLFKEYDLPKMVYLYFSYECNLSWERTAYLYAHVIQKRDEMPEIYNTYRDKIEIFVMDQIMAEHIDRNLAQIYRFILPEFALTEDMSEALSRLIFMHCVKVSNPAYTHVVIYQNKETVESVYPITDGMAYLPVYDKDYTLLFEDILSNRYIKSADYELEKIIVPGKLAVMIADDVHHNLDFDVFLCESSTDNSGVNEENRERYKSILESDIIDCEYKADIRSKLMQYYYYNDRLRELDEILTSAEPEGINRPLRVLVVRYMILRGMFDKALEWLVNYGIEGTDLKDIVKLCSKIISRDEYAESEGLLRLSASIFFKGKYDEAVLKYLIMYYHGMTRDMRKIFKAAENFDLDLHDLCETLIVQMLYTGYFIPERMSIYRKYVQGGANAEVQAAFLAQCAFEYFVREQLTDGYVFEQMTTLYMTGEDTQLVCKLAYLKYYSETRAEIDGNVRSIIKKYINELLDAGIYMSFFKEFQNIESRLSGYSDKTVIEYKTEPGRKVLIHYIIEGDEDAGGEYMTEEMPDLFGGVHVKSFVLFFGENLLYYITEDTETESLLTESGNVSKSDIGESDSSRFSEINDIAIAKTLGDFDTVDNLMYDYYKHEFIVKKMFNIQ